MAKFKVGDRVNTACGPGCVINIFLTTIGVDLDRYCATSFFHEGDIELVDPVKRTSKDDEIESFVVVSESAPGQPRCISKVYASKQAAEDFARKSAKEKPGVEFEVFKRYKGFRATVSVQETT